MHKAHIEHVGGQQHARFEGFESKFFQAVDGCCVRRTCLLISEDGQITQQAVTGTGAQGCSHEDCENALGTEVAKVSKYA